MKHVAQPEFWRNYSKLDPRLRKSVEDAWHIFKTDPFDPRLKTHRDDALSAVFRRPVHAVEIEPALRVIFYTDGDLLVIVTAITHPIGKI